MGFKSIVGATCASLAVVSFSANSALIDRGNGLIYDEDLDITWLQDANAGAGSIYDDGVDLTDGRMSWENANAWAASLTVGGVSGWRLPTTLQPFLCAGPSINGYDFNCSGIEMGHLFYNELGNKAQYSPTGILQPDYGLSNSEPFINLMAESYWSATEFDTGVAYRFDFSNGGLDETPTSFNFFALAVHDGDIGAVPIPPAIWLFGSGLIGLVGLARRKADA